MTVELRIDEHPLLDAVVFTSVFQVSLGNSSTPSSIIGLLSRDSGAPLARDERVRAEARNLLRLGGYKPTGRGKPASEYLLKASELEPLGSINIAVDVLNAVSLHSGLPISVVDLELAKPPFRIGIADDEERYVFNASGQEIALGGLLCLHDGEGPCANGVKDCQRTKTRNETTETLSVIWGTSALSDYTDRVFAWHRALLETCGACVERVITS